MTALAGYWRFGGRGASSPCSAMLRAQALYGPDDAAQADLGEISLGRSLRRTLSEDAFDTGPISGGDGALTLAADVRLDNRGELISALRLGGEAAGMCDAAVLMAAVEAWGEAAAMQRLVGDFAFALWNARSGTLLLARDPLGERPLHVHQGRSMIAFSSMPKGLHALPEIPYAPRASAAADFLANTPETGPESFFEGVDRVLPGHVMTVTPAGAHQRRWWSPRFTTLRLKTDAEYAEGLRSHLETAVKARLRTHHGGVGAHLSAGLDSSTVATTAARLLAPGALTTFTAAPDGPWEAPDNRIGDEWPLAQATASLHPNIEAVRIGTGGASPLAALDRNFFLFERPLLNLCNGTWLDALNREAQLRRISVMLTGQMGNMSISHAGYEALPGHLRAGRLPAAASLALALRRNGHRWGPLASRGLGPLLPRSLWRGLRRRFRTPSSLYEHSAIRPSAAEMLGVLDRAVERGLDFDAPPWADGRAMRLWVLRRVDRGNYNKGLMAGWGLDYRDPTADRRLIEYCLAIPEEQFILGGQPRSLLRRAFADRLPPAVLEERRKGMQGADWGASLSSAKAEIGAELEGLAACGPAADLIDVDGLKRALAEAPANGWARPEVVNRYRLALLRGVSAGHFLRRASRTNA